MGVVSYTKPVAGDARTAASINSITDAISTQSTNVQSINIAQGGIEKRNIASYASRRTGSISESAVSGTLNNTSAALLTIGSTNMTFDFSSQWGANVTLTDKDAIRVYACFQGDLVTESLSMYIYSKLAGGSATAEPKTERRMQGNLTSHTTMKWIQPAAGATEEFEEISIYTKLNSAGGYKAGFAYLVVTLFRDIGRLS